MPLHGKSPGLRLRTLPWWSVVFKDMLRTEYVREYPGCQSCSRDDALLYRNLPDPLLYVSYSVVARISAINARGMELIELPDAANYISERNFQRVLVSTRGLKARERVLTFDAPQGLKFALTSVIYFIISHQSGEKNTK